MIVHHLNNSHSHVILWLLEELGVPYEIVQHARDPVTGRSPGSLAAVHPIAKAPTIEDQGVTMIESTGIILYILEKYGESRLRPPAGSADAMRFLQYLTFIEGSAKAPVSGCFRMVGKPADDPARQAAEQYAARQIDVLEQALAEGGGTLVPGQFTAADMQVTFFGELVEGLLPLERWPALQARITASREMAGYRRAEAKGGPVGIRDLFTRLTRTMATAGRAG